MDRVEERRLIQQAQQGDTDAFAQIYRANVQAVFRYVSYRTSNVQLAEDLTSEIFTRALEGLPKYQDRGKPFVAWLYTIAHARIADHYRKTNRRPDESDVEKHQIAVTPDMDENLVRRHAARTLREAIGLLTEDQQQVIILRFIEGERIETVATIMGKKPNAIKALQHRALRSLAKHLSRSGVDIDSIMAGLS